MLTPLLLAMLVSTTPKSCCAPSMAAFASDPSFLAAHLAPLPLRFKAKEGHTVSYSDANGKPTDGFYIAPKPGVKASVVMVHEWWGLNDYIRRQAEMLHDTMGYGVLAVDLYEGKVASQPKEAGALMQAVDSARATAVVKGAVTALKGGTFGTRASKVGTVGWCFGGGWSLATAIQGGPEVNACVMYYGLPDDEPAHLAQLRAPVLLFWGTQDKWINREVVNKFETAMKTANRSLTVHEYDADHGFANPSNPKFNPTATADAWSKTLAFYRKNLG